MTKFNEIMCQGHVRVGRRRKVDTSIRNVNATKFMIKLGSQA